MSSCECGTVYWKVPIRFGRCVCVCAHHTRHTGVHEMATKKSVVKVLVAQNSFAGACEYLGVPQKDGVYVTVHGQTRNARDLGINPSSRLADFIAGNPVKLSGRWENNARSVNVLLPVAALAFGQDKGAYLTFVDAGKVASVYASTFMIAAKVASGVMTGGVAPVLASYDVKLADVHGVMVYRPIRDNGDTPAPKGDAPATDLKTLFETAFKPAPTRQRRQTAKPAQPASK